MEGRYFPCINPLGSACGCKQGDGTCSLYIPKDILQKVASGEKTNLHGVYNCPYLRRSIIEYCRFNEQTTCENNGPKIIMYFPNTGVHDAMDKLQLEGKTNALLQFTDLMYTQRALTDEEIKEFNLKYRIGYDGYYKIHGEYPKNTTYNVNFVDDTKKRIYALIKENEYEYIFMIYKPFICEWFNEIKQNFWLVYPENDLKAEYIGDIVIKTNQKYKYTKIDKGAEKDDESSVLNEYRLDITDPKYMNTMWDNCMKKIEKMDISKRIILKRNQYLKDILDKI